MTCLSRKDDQRTRTDRCDRPGGRGCANENEAPGPLGRGDVSDLDADLAWHGTAPRQLGQEGVTTGGCLPPALRAPPEDICGKMKAGRLRLNDLMVSSGGDTGRDADGRER